MRSVRKISVAALAVSFSFLFHISPSTLAGTVTSGFENKNTTVGTPFSIGPTTDRAIFSGDAFAGSLGVTSLYFDGVRSWMVVGGGTGFIDFEQITSDVSFWARTSGNATGTTEISAFAAGGAAGGQQIGSTVVLSAPNPFQLVSFSGLISQIEVLNNDASRINAVDRITFTTFVEPPSVPEPSTFVLGLLALVTLAGWRLGRCRS